jgi:hypothetical protein
MVIKNGTGDGVSAKVYPDNHLAVKSMSEPILGYRSRVEESAFAMHTPYIWTVGTSALSVMVVHNAETEKSFCINKIYVSHNGGSTSHNRTIQATMYKSSTIPTTNILGNTAIAFGNLNLKSSKITAVKAYIWNGSSTGLDGTKGTLAMNSLFGQGFTVIELANSVILGPSQIIRVDYLAEENTQCALSLSGFLDY